MKLYNYDLSSKPVLEEARDLFVFGCYVGLRYSDYSDVKPENIQMIEGEYIKMFTQKTGELVVIPCNNTVLEIFEKYKHNPNRLPSKVPIQKFNDRIKEASLEAGLTELGRLLKAPKTPFCELITSHTARRSFATNLYLEGFPPMEIMKITGHRTEKAFMKYLKISKQDAANRLRKHIQIRSEQNS